MPERAAPGATVHGGGRLLLLDAPSVWFRAYHGVPRTVTAPDGTPVNAVRGFFEVVARQLTDTRAPLFAACLDLDWRPAFRVALLPSYKAHRVDLQEPDGPPAADGGGGGDGTPPEMQPQVTLILEVLDALGLAAPGHPGYEADDVIGTLAEHHDGPVDIVTGDRDLLQLVRDDKPVRVLYTVERLKPYTEAEVAGKYGIPGRGYGEFALLRGDPSDGLPGVPGVGAKTAATLVTRFGTVSAMLAALDSGEQDGFPAGARNRIAAARDYLAKAADVVRVARDLPLGPLELAVPRSPADPARLVDLCDRWGLSGPMERVLRALEVVHAG